MITKNAAEWIKYSIKSFIDYVGELIIVDDQSTDDTLEIASSFGKKVKIVRGVYNGDKTTQRNEYIKRARGQWLITPDSDEVFYKDDIEWLIKYLANEVGNDIIIGIHYHTFWKDFCHVIHGHTWDMVRHRIFKNIKGIYHGKYHFAVSMPKDQFKHETILHTYAVENNLRNRVKSFSLAHYGYCGPSQEIRKKIEYYMRRDNPNCTTDKLVKMYTNKHPYFSSKFKAPRYGDKGLYCCGQHNGQREHVVRFTGEHPRVMKKHPKYPLLHDYVINMNKYMEDHWQFHNHIHHERHQKRLNLTGGFCIGHTLDVGCGNGISTDTLQKFYPKKQFSGVEPTDWGFEHAVKDYKHLKFYKDYGENLSMEDGSFDTVLLSEIIEHVHDPRKLANEAWRVAKKRMVITTPSQPHPDPDHKRFYTVNEMRTFLKRYGKPAIHGLTREGKVTDREDDIYFIVAFVQKYEASDK